MRRLWAAALVLGLAACGQDQTESEAQAPAEAAPEAVAETAAPEAAPAAIDAGGDIASVDTARIAADQEPQNWLSHGRTYSEQRYSPLDQIDADTVGDLELAWYYDLPVNRGIEATPIVVGGTMYTTTAWSLVYAFDAASGKLKWVYDPEVPRDWAFNACCDVVNRGVAIYEGMVYSATLDGRLLALDAETGEKVWETNTIDRSKPYTITGAPRIVKGKVMIGNGGAEYGVRGYLSAYDAKSGALAWRFYTVPGNPEDGFENAAMEMAAETWKGEWWKAGGGGTVWDSMAYDPELDLLIIGVGNGSPWNHELRSEGEGDNLFLSSMVALKPDTGEYVWHYQTTPGETWDYTATQHIILADMEIDGAMRKVAMQAPKNGFFYVVDRATGEFISAENYVEMTWATGVDPATGRPIEAEDARDFSEPKIVFPGALGGHNWHPMAYHPGHNLVYIPAQDAPFAYSPQEGWDYDPTTWNTGFDFATGQSPDDDDVQIGFIKEYLKGRLLAWDPVKQERAWAVEHGGPWNGGILATGGNLVFQGNHAGVFAAYTADKGEKLWEFDAQTGVVAAPMTYEMGGEQYVAVMAGWGGAYALGAGRAAEDARVENVSRVLVFKKGGGAALPDLASYDKGVPEPPALDATEEVLAQGKFHFGRNCSVCHGDTAIGGGVVPDLRYSASLEDAEFWNEIVMDGALAGNGMIAFAHRLDAEESDAIRHYVIKRSHDRVKELADAGDAQ